MTKILYGNFEKSFLECEVNGFKNIFRHFFHTNFLMFVLLISNHTVFFSFNSELICTCEFFIKLKLHSPKRLMQFQLFEKLTRAN